MLRKDNMLDEEIAKKQDLDQLTTDEKLDRLERSLRELLERLKTVMDEFNETQQYIKRRVTKAEKEARNELLRGPKT